MFFVFFVFNHKFLREKEFNSNFVKFIVYFKIVKNYKNHIAIFIQIIFSNKKESHLQIFQNIFALRINYVSEYIFLFILYNFKFKI